MKRVLVLIIAAAMGLSSVASTAETVTTPTSAATITKVAPAETTHHKKQHKAVPAQGAQVVKKHHKNAKAEQKAPEQKAQTAKKHAKKHSHQQPAKPAVQPVV